MKIQDVSKGANKQEFFVLFCLFNFENLKTLQESPENNTPDIMYSKTSKCQSFTFFPLSKKAQLESPLCSSLVPFSSFLFLGLPLICIWCILLNLGFFSELKALAWDWGGGEGISDDLGGENGNNTYFSKWKVKWKEVNMLLGRGMFLMQSL